MKIIILLLLSFSSNLFASYPEFFGSSFTTSAIGNQANLDINDPSNNYYAPSLLGFTKRVNAVLQATVTQTNLKDISNIAVTNSTNSSTATPTYGKVSTAYPNFWGSSLHLSLPVGYENHGTLGTLGLSLYLPIGKLIETNSGSPFLPEYVLYHSRYQRTSVYLNFAHAISDDLSFSLGGFLGYQASANADANISMNGATYGSSAQAHIKIAPSIGAIVSLAKKINQNKIYFTYQQEMKSNVHLIANGNIANPLPLSFSTTIDSVIFYDPHTFRVGGDYIFSTYQLFLCLEYQLWAGYKSPIVSVKKNSGVVISSTDYEVITTRNTINPKLGIKNKLTDRWSTSLGISYRQSPLSGDFSGNGNSIDSDTIIYSGGIQYRMVIWSKDVHLGTSFEYHKLKDQDVIKSTNTESGTSGVKIGAPGYNIGGNVMSGSFGVKFNF